MASSQPLVRPRTPPLAPSPRRRPSQDDPRRRPSPPPCANGPRRRPSISCLESHSRPSSPSQSLSHNSPRGTMMINGVAMPCSTKASSSALAVLAKMHAPSLSQLSGTGSKSQGVAQGLRRVPSLPWHDPDSVAALDRSSALHEQTRQISHSDRQQTPRAPERASGSRTVSKDSCSQVPMTNMYTFANDAAYQRVPVEEVEESQQVMPQELLNVVEVPSEPPEPSACQNCGVWFLQSAGFQTIMALLIISNSLVIGMETDMRDYPYWNLIENAFLGAFFVELSLKLSFFGPKEMFDITNLDFNWNCFDSFIVTLGLLDVFMSAVLGKSSGSAATLFRIIRLLRILRIIRIVKFLKQLYLLAFGLVDAAQAVFWVTILMTFIIYVCAIIMVKTVGRPDMSDPHHDFLTEHFGAVLPSMCTLFVLMSSPNMPIYQDEAGLLESRPAFAMFLVIFIIFGSFGMIALLTGVISESMFEKNDMKKEEDRVSHEMMRRGMEEECSKIFNSLTLDEEGAATTKDVKTALPQMSIVFDDMGVFFSQYDLNKIVDYMDIDESGTIDEDEFTRGMLVLAEGVRPISIQEVYHQVGVCRVKLERMEGTMGIKTGKDQIEVQDFVKAGTIVEAGSVAEREGTGGTASSQSPNAEASRNAWRHDSREGSPTGKASRNSWSRESQEVLEAGSSSAVLKHVGAYLEEVLSAQRNSFSELAAEVRQLISVHANGVEHSEGFSPTGHAKRASLSGPEGMASLLVPRPVRGYAAQQAGPPAGTHHGTGTPSTTISSSTSAWPNSWAHSGWPVGAAAPDLVYRTPSRPEHGSSDPTQVDSHLEMDKFVDPFVTFGPMPISEDVVAGSQPPRGRYSSGSEGDIAASLPPRGTCAGGSSPPLPQAAAARPLHRVSHWQQSSGPLPADDGAAAEQLPASFGKRRGESNPSERYRALTIETEWAESSPATSSPSPPSLPSVLPQDVHRSPMDPNNSLAGSGSPPVGLAISREALRGGSPQGRARFEGSMQGRTAGGTLVARGGALPPGREHGRADMGARFAEALQAEATFSHGAGFSKTGPLPTLLQDLEIETARLAAMTEMGRLTTEVKVSEGWHRDARVGVHRTASAPHLSPIIEADPDEQVCTCGSSFAPQALFCRHCGEGRREEESSAADSALGHEANIRLVGLLGQLRQLLGSREAAAAIQ